MTPRKHVLVTGAGGPSGTAAIAALKARGFSLTAVDMNETPHEADQFLRVPAAGDPAFLPTLTDLVRELRIDWVFPTVSEELVPLADHAPALRRAGVAIYISSGETARLCDDKWETMLCLTRAGVAVPRSAIGSPEYAGVRSLGFPCLSKPRVGRGGRGVAIHDDPLSLFDVDIGGTVWQEFMPGTEYDVILLIHPDPPHAVMAQAVFEKTAMREGRVGNAVSLVPAIAKDVAALAIAAARAVGLRGPADLDIRRDRNGQPRVLEINARIGAHTLRAPQIFDALVSLFHQGHLGG